MNYIEVFNKHAIISKLPLKVGNRELRSCIKAKLFLLRVQYNNVIETFEKEIGNVSLTATGLNINMFQGLGEDLAKWETNINAAFAALNQEV